MAPTSNPSADPDPTTQIAWPSGKAAGGTRDDSAVGASSAVNLDVPGGHVRFAERNRSRSPAPSTASNKKKEKPGERRLTFWDFIFLSISMLGAQITWSVELGYGTPFLVGLGVTETATSLVWLAGPISGLIAQPLIGAISDSSVSKYRRRIWISLSTGLLCFALLGLAYCRPWGAFLVDIFGGGAGDWDPKREKQAQNAAIAIAVVAFYILDFALNACQASLRNLLLDIAPSDQLSLGNAWHGRMTHAGNIIGTTIGFAPLDKVPIINLLGGDQFRKFCVIALVILAVTVWITCATQEEKERPQSLDRVTAGKLGEAIGNIRSAITQLPKPIRRVCFVQLFAFMGWFPFLFYSTLWVGQVMAYERQVDPSVDEATRAGEFALLIYSIAAVCAGTILPYLAQRDSRLLAHESDNAADDAEMTRLRTMVLEWQAESARQGKAIKLPYMPFLLRNIWTGAMLLFSAVMFSTFFITRVWQATLAIGIVGICWAVACWVPFSIIMEFLKEMEKSEVTVQNRSDTRRARSPGRRPSHSRVASTPAYLHPGFLADGERTPLLRHRSMDDADAVDLDEKGPIAGGTVLGIHNLAIVAPQFIVSIVASIIFRIADAKVQDDPTQDATYLGKTGVSWVLRFGGFCTLFAALIARAVPPTNTEKAMRRRLAHLRVLKDAGSP